MYYLSIMYVFVYVCVYVFGWMCIPTDAKLFWQSPVQNSVYKPTWLVDVM